MKFPDFFGWRKEAESSWAEAERETAFVLSLSLDEARRRADGLLRDPETFELTPLAADLPDWLIGTSRDAFLTYGNMRGRKTEMAFSTDVMEDSLALPGHFLCIGADWEFTEIAVRPGLDRVFSIYVCETLEQALKNEYPSLFHYIVHWHDIPEFS